MNTIRAKMTCKEVSRTDWGAEQVFLHPVHSNADVPEDNTFSKATPAGRVELTVSNPDAQGFFTAGKSYYVDFTPATT